MLGGGRPPGEEAQEALGVKPKATPDTESLPPLSVKDVRKLSKQETVRVEPGGFVHLYRAVSAEERAAIEASNGRFTPGGPAAYETGKWLAETPEAAKRWGDAFSKMDGKAYSVVDVRVRVDQSLKMQRFQNLDGIGNARFSTFEHLREVEIRDFNAGK